MARPGVTRRVAGDEEEEDEEDEDEEEQQEDGTGKIYVFGEFIDCKRLGGTMVFHHTHPCPLMS